MANKRMFSKKITDSDAFIDMPPTSQNLYFHLSMNADDDGFVSSPKRIMKMINSSTDDYKILLTKRFILSFESGVCVIKHWWMHNEIKKDRYHLTAYQDEFKMLRIKGNGAYTDSLVPECIQVVSEVVPQTKLNETKLNKTNSEETSRSVQIEDLKQETDTPMNLQEFIIWCKKSPQTHIRIIADWAEAEEPKLNTKGQWKAFIVRNIRVAKRLSPFTSEQMQEAYDKLRKDLVRENKRTGKKEGFITKYTLETLEKYLIF
jgi:hypothetical protein